MKFFKSRIPWILLGIAVIYGVVCLDVVLRCREAYLEGEKATSPRLAYAWYETAATLYVPPESKWSRLAREKMKVAREQWKADVRARGLNFPDSFFE